ncbi:DUF7504 family protein [Haladaptatus sp. DFWS20]|uniref:DUF7504 family protein n=1 Tax=Haladaptatus sp. DFWS20 TaxID=3403467 RepID=UPI003EB8E631
MNGCRLSFRNEEDAHAFREHLGSLRQRGSNLLVTGEVSQSVTNRASRTLFGDDATERKRILALTDTGVDTVTDHFPDDIEYDEASLRLIDCGNKRRAVPRSETVVDRDLPPLDEQGGLRELREEIITAIGFYEDAVGGGAPAQIRLCVDSLNYLVDEYELVAVKRFVRSIGALIKGVRGMAHFHLSMPDDMAIVQELSPLFDARIELRHRAGRDPDNRWHVPELEMTTAWVDL